MATIIKTDGSQEHRSHLTFEECQQIVGGYVEPVYMDDMIILANEDGYSLQLAPNDDASILAGIPLLGDVVVCTQKEGLAILNKGSSY